VIEQLAEPATIYHRPATAFVLGFVGLSTRLSGSVSGQAGEGVVVATRYGPVRATGKLGQGTKAFVGVRPERMDLTLDAGRENVIELALRDVVFQGSKIQLHFSAAEGDQVMVETAQLPALPLAPGTKVKMTFAAADAIAFPAEGIP
jgi:putative spermidine/putrescine transport system ATP-binding protein